MSEPVRGLSAVVARKPLQVRVSWDRIDDPDFAGVKIIWWRIGDPVTQITRPILWVTRYLIPANLGETYVVAARAHFRVQPWTEWAYVVVEVPSEEDEPQYIDLGEMHIVDTPKGPAVLLDDLRDAFS